jgi:hypothetical protein
VVKFFAEGIEELRAFAEAQFSMSFPIGDGGAPEREHLLKMAEQHDIVDPRLLVQLPVDMAGYWNYYCLLSQGRSSDKPITYTDIVSFCQLYGLRFSIYTIHVIKELDVLWLDMQSKNMRERMRKNG